MTKWPLMYGIKTKSLAGEHIDTLYLGDVSHGVKDMNTTSSGVHCVVTSPNFTGQVHRCTILKVYTLIPGVCLPHIQLTKAMLSLVFACIRHTGKVATIIPAYLPSLLTGKLDIVIWILNDLWSFHSKCNTSYILTKGEVYKNGTPTPN